MVDEEALRQHLFTQPLAPQDLFLLIAADPVSQRAFSWSYLPAGGSSLRAPGHPGVWSPRGWITTDIGPVCSDTYNYRNLAGGLTRQQLRLVAEAFGAEFT
jgi:hypothetical protein